MRHPIKASTLNNGTSIIPRDDATETDVVAHWSTEAGQWVGENGEPPGIAPTHRYPVPRDQYLLPEDDIGAARAVLERAVETGSAQASFMLAETYDPGILSAWGTYGTRGEVRKARELYAKANAGGIQEAKDRLRALGP